MKRWGLIATLGVSVVGVSSYALADRISLLIEELPMQSAEPDFKIPDSKPLIDTAYRAKSDVGSIPVATATPFASKAPSSTGAVEALEAIAGRNRGIALETKAFEAAGLGFDADRTPVPMTTPVLVTEVASTIGSAKPSADEEQVHRPKSLATKLFDTDDREWRSSIYRDNPLVGSIVAADGSPSDPDSLVNAVKGARYVLLGEIHDNPDHHRLQAGIIRGASQPDSKPAVVFEMIPETFSDVLKNIDASTPVDISSLARKLDWNARGWPDFSIYAPIFEAAIENGLPIVAGNFDNATVRELAEKGVDAVSPDERTRLGLDLAVDPALRQDLMAELKSAHCGLLPEAALRPMEFAQRLRDGAMAAAMIEAADANGSAILVAGSGHARKDRGVPAVIEGLTGDDDSVAVQMVEISDASGTSLAAYGLSEDMPAPFDFTIFTPRANDTDHCAELEAQMKAKSDVPSEERAN